MGHKHTDPKDIADLPAYIPYTTSRLKDGGYLVNPGKPVFRATCGQTSRWTGVSGKTLHKLADCGYIRRQNPSPNVFFFFPMEVEEFLKRTEEDDNFWNEVRKAAYLNGPRLAYRKRGGTTKNTKRSKGGRR